MPLVTLIKFRAFFNLLDTRALRCLPGMGRHSGMCNWLNKGDACLRDLRAIVWMRQRLADTVSLVLGIFEHGEGALTLREYGFWRTTGVVYPSGHDST